MKIILISILVSLSVSAFAGWDEDFQALKNIPRSYEDIGAICEEIAKLKFEREFSSTNFKTVVGISYSDNQRTLGELDIVVFDLNKKTVVHIAEVKCWKNMASGLAKAKDQRARFLLNVNSSKSISFQLDETLEKYSTEQFQGPIQFTTIGQKGSQQFGYDAELEYDLRDLHRMGMEMLRCQDRGECAKP